MAETTRVVVYGSSLFMAGLAASLKANPSLNVIHIVSGSPALEQCRQALAPSAIMFDLSEMPTDLALSQLRTCPGLMLIGVDPASEDILLLSGQQVRAVTMTELAELITGTSIGSQESSPTGHGSSTEKE